MNSNFPFESYCDELGPAKIAHLYDPETGMRGMVVIDNVACGPAIGGVRMLPDVSTDEVFRLARAMTLKNASAGLPHGGGKAGIMADPRSPNKLRIVRAFASAIASLVDYVPGPDMGTDEQCMAVVKDEIGRAVGLPRVLGGIPLDEIGATGYGIAQAAEVATAYCNLDLAGARVAIEGFGNVGRHAARFLCQRGAKLVAASDTGGAVYNADGIDVNRLDEIKRSTGSVAGYTDAERIAPAQLFTSPCDILVPAARPDCIHADNARQIQAKLILQGANIPATAEAETILHQRGVLVVPDFIANAGGVICASVEFHGGNEADALEQIATKIRHNTEVVLKRAGEEKIESRQAAMQMARERVSLAMSLRRKS